MLLLTVRNELSVGFHPFYRPRRASGWVEVWLYSFQNLGTRLGGGEGVRHMLQPPGMNSHQIISDGLDEVSLKPMSL